MKINNNNNLQKQNNSNKNKNNNKIILYNLYKTYFKCFK